MRVELKSSNLEFADYSPDTRILKIGFKGGSIYAYEGVPERLFSSLLLSDSKGKFFHSEIKNQFKFRREI